MTSVEWSFRFCFYFSKIEFRKLIVLRNKNWSTQLGMSLIGRVIISILFFVYFSKMEFRKLIVQTYTDPNILHL